MFGLPLKDPEISTYATPWLEPVHWKLSAPGKGGTCTGKYVCMHVVCMCVYLYACMYVFTERERERERERESIGYLVNFSQF
jgi:hypothetical protein